MSEYLILNLLKILKLLKDNAYGGVNVKNVKISAQPDYTKGQFGTIIVDLYPDKGSYYHEEKIVCNSKNGNDMSISYDIVRDNNTRQHFNGVTTKIQNHKNVYAKMCERINTCVGFGSQPQA
jgi:hypothetical protein